VSISALEGRRVALWGWGREGRAAWRALRSRLPAQPLTVFCSAAEAVEIAALGDALLATRTDVDAEALAAFDVVVKSPGISPYREDAQTAAMHGTTFVGGSRLWFEERPGAATLCVTGTKGKSTTTSLLAHLLRAGGHRTALAGNIGLPMLELLDGHAEYWAIELSSYQTRDVAASGVHPLMAIVTNIFPEHLDWHGSEDRYVGDKLALLTEARPRYAVLNAGDRHLAALKLPDTDVRWFNQSGRWHMRGDWVWRANERILDTTQMALPGSHNRGNLCAVLTAIELLGLDATALAPHALTFSPLPNRLQALGTRDGIEYVNDSISTTPQTALAALDVYRDQKVALLAGGHDRGLDWQVFADAMEHRPPCAVVTMGENGPRIHALLEPLARQGRFQLRAADGLEDAMAKARQALHGHGVMLLSPGAPSYGPYTDYVARGRHFAQLAGFEPDAISAIGGLGIA